MSNKLWAILILAIILRLFLAFSTFHPDIRAFHFGGAVVASGHVLDLYDYLATLPPDSEAVRIFGQDLFIYPPAIYLLSGLFHFIYVNIWGLKFFDTFLINNDAAYGNILFNWQQLLLKLPYFIFDIASAFLLLNLFEDKKSKTTAFVLWLFNPINLYITYMMGQFDIIAVFFTVLSLFLLHKKKIYWSAISLGFGIAFKIFPLFLIIALALTGKTFWQKVKIFIIGISPYVISIIPYLPSHGFRSSALVAGQTLKSLYAAIPISGGESILLFPTFLLFFYILYYYRRLGLNIIWQSYFIILLLFFIFTHYHPQWFLWLSPFFILSLVYSNMENLLPIILSILSFIGLLFFFDPSLTINILDPLIPSLHDQPSVWQLLRINIDYNMARSILQTVFVSAALYLIYLYFPKTHQVEDNG